jgi:hypothetical protein
VTDKNWQRLSEYVTEITDSPSDAIDALALPIALIGKTQGKSADELACHVGAQCRSLEKPESTPIDGDRLMIGSRYVATELPKIAAKFSVAIEDVQAIFDERAAIFEYDSGMTRVEAEQRALTEVETILARTVKQTEMAI